MRLIVLCEGQTERTFCEELLRPWLGPHCTLAATDLNPGGVQQGRRNRGGHAHDFRVIERDLSKLLRGRFDIVTTMLDLYHLPSNFPGLGQAANHQDPIERALFLERSFFEHMGAPSSFVPNLLVHEFEALLFADPAILRQTEYLPSAVRREMSELAEGCRSPEHINKDRPPAVRIIESMKRHCGDEMRYEKPLQGNLVALEVGLEAMRASCAHFAAWLAALGERAAGG